MIKRILYCFLFLLVILGAAFFVLLARDSAVIFKSSIYSTDEHLPIAIGDTELLDCVGKDKYSNNHCILGNKINFQTGIILNSNFVSTRNSSGFLDIKSIHTRLTSSGIELIEDSGKVFFSLMSNEDFGLNDDFYKTYYKEFVLEDGKFQNFILDEKELFFVVTDTTNLKRYVAKSTLQEDGKRKGEFFNLDIANKIFLFSFYTTNKLDKNNFEEAYGGSYKMLDRKNFKFYTEDGKNYTLESLDSKDIYSNGTFIEEGFEPFGSVNRFNPYGSKIFFKKNGDNHSYVMSFESGEPKMEKLILGDILESINPGIISFLGEKYYNIFK